MIGKISMVVDNVGLTVNACTDQTQIWIIVLVKQNNPIYIKMNEYLIAEPEIVSKLL